MNLTTEDTGDVIVLTLLEDKLDAHISLLFKETALASLRDGRSQYLLDLTSVNFIDSSGIGAIVGVLKGLRPGETLKVCGLNPAVERVFQLLRLNRVLSLYNTKEDALEEFELSNQSAASERGQASAPGMMPWAE